MALRQWGRHFQKNPYTITSTSYFIFCHNSSKFNLLKRKKETGRDRNKEETDKSERKEQVWNSARGLKEWVWIVTIEYY